MARELKSISIFVLWVGLLCVQTNAQTDNAATTTQATLSPQSGPDQNVQQASETATAAPVLVVPARTGILHVATQLPESVKLDGAAGWRLVEVGYPDHVIAIQLASAIADDGSAKPARAMLLADIPPRDGARDSRRFRLQPVQPAPAKPHRLLYRELSDKSLGLWEDDNPVLVYNHGTITNDEVPTSDHRRHRAAYVHPLWGLDGEILTDDFPTDHYHHHGVFWAWPHVGIDGQHYDLWTYRNIQHKFLNWLGREAGPAGAVLGIENGWFVGDRQVMLERVWLRVFHATDTSRTVDITLTWIPTDKPVTLQGAAGKSYGGLTLRVAPRPHDDTVITVPSGRTDRDLPDTQLAWADIAGTFGDAATPSGITIMVDPGHPDFPPTWLTRHYGALCVGWPGVTPRTIPPGQPIRLNYRIWVHKNVVDEAVLKRAYEDYVAATKVAWQ